MLHKWWTTSSLVSPIDTWHSSALIHFLAWVCSTMLWGVGLCYIMVYKLAKSAHKWHLAVLSSRITSSCIPNYKHMTLAISFLILTSSPSMLKQKTIIASIPMCYAKCQYVYILLLKKLTYVNKYSLIMVMSGRDTLKPIRYVGVLFRPFSLFPNFYWLHLHNNTHIVLTNLQINICKKQIKNKTYLDSFMVIRIACLLIYWLGT